MPKKKVHYEYYITMNGDVTDEAKGKMLGTMEDVEQTLTERIQLTIDAQTNHSQSQVEKLCNELETHVNEMHDKDYTTLGKLQLIDRVERAKRDLDSQSEERTATIIIRGFTKHAYYHSGSKTQKVIALPITSVKVPDLKINIETERLRIKTHNRVAPKEPKETT